MVVLEPHVEEPISPIVVGEPNVDTALPLSVEVATTDAPRPLATTAEQVGRVRVIPNVPSPQPDSIRPLEEINKDDIVLPLADVEGDVVCGGSVEWVTLTDTTYWWPVLVFTQQLLTGGNPVKVQRCNMRDGSTGGDWANDTTLTRTTVSVPVSPDLSKATPLWLISQLVDQALIVTKTENNKTHYYRV
ncbi:hypothetical protein SPFM10_00131 [Salmonella phage SPFM10]|nr:hypothetical protein SPFM10_00131 [Salmonella phage SPFM10]